jgi:hypothetical protein
VNSKAREHIAKAEAVLELTSGVCTHDVEFAHMAGVRAQAHVALAEFYAAWGDPEVTE